MYVTEFTVQGNGREASSNQRYFPLDMLRYDTCWPMRPDDVSKLTSDPLVGDEVREVTLMTMRRTKGEHAVTIDRWLSFGWPVVDIKQPRKV